MEVAKLLPEFIRVRDVQAMVGLSRASIYRLIAAGQFPKQVKLGERASAWVRYEVEAWVQAKISNRAA